MIWLTWRQFRVPASTIFAAVAVLAIFLAITGPHLVHTYYADEPGFVPRIQADQVLKILYLAGAALIYATPAIIGAFWGAPLIARELETDTQRLVWSQSITRARWLSTKLGVTVLAAVAASGLLSLAVSWWSSPIDQAVNHGDGTGTFDLVRLAPSGFGARGIVPIGYTVLALTLGCTVGLVLRRSVAAIAVTLALVIVIQLFMPLVVRAHLIAPARLTLTISESNMAGMIMNSDPGGALTSVGDIRVKAGTPADWMLSNQTVNAAGTVQHALPLWVSDCALTKQPPGQTSSADERKSQQARSQACFDRLASGGYRQLVRYQPASRFWALQWRETALLLAVAALLIGFCFRRIQP
jgi:ABC-type transport system involved in multi-copper enzyme maturation permease subunit